MGVETMPQTQKTIEGTEMAIDDDAPLYDPERIRRIERRQSAMAREQTLIRTTVGAMAGKLDAVLANQANRGPAYLQPVVLFAGLAMVLAFVLFVRELGATNTGKLLDRMNHTAPTAVVEPTQE